MAVYIVVEEAAVTEWIVADDGDEALAKRKSVNGEMFVRLGDGRFDERPLGDAVADAEREAERSGESDGE